MFRYELTVETGSDLSLGIDCENHRIRCSTPRCRIEYGDILGPGGRNVRGCNGGCQLS
jgi:hypothetical protein